MDVEERLGSRLWIWVMCRLAERRVTFEQPKPDLMGGGVTRAALMRLFGGKLPVDWPLVMSGVLEVLEQSARGPLGRELTKRRVRTLWFEGPCPERYFAGMRVLRGFNVAVLMEQHTVDVYTELKVKLVGANGRTAVFSWAVAYDHDGALRTLISVE